MEDKNTNASSSIDLGEERRVKVLSPGMLVAKRFFRNKLAVVGLVILVSMFIFSFIGGALNPYRETQVFRSTEMFWKDYAGAGKNTAWIYYEKEGQSLPNAARQRFIKVTGEEGSSSFEAGGITYQALHKAEDLFEISVGEPVATVTTLKGRSSVKGVGEAELSEAFTTACKAALEAGEESFEAEGASYMVTGSGREQTIVSQQEVAVATHEVFNLTKEDAVASYDLVKAALGHLFGEGVGEFEAEGKTYVLEAGVDGDDAKILLDSELVATVSDLLISPQTKGTFLSLAFKEAVTDAIEAGASEFEVEGETFQLQKKNTQYLIRNQKETVVNATYLFPQKEHLLGTDGNGMDMLTRLMYGGRISLLIGFVVILIETAIGIVIGGISGYFGGWVDTLLMRLVDVAICIPGMPLYIIIGAVMDYYQVDPRIRIYLLCIILGLLGWPGIARMVRGQILSLREQEFILATEATGIRVSRRIFRHLIPNVVPQLIVIATMGLGDVILTEATLSFLGLGVKFPFASWGNIVNAVNDVYVLTEFWFVWVPAGFLILITVLGFNFVGDGLRDAFDPKMKR